MRSEPGCHGVEETVAAKIEMYPGSEVFLRVCGEEARTFMGIVNDYLQVDYRGDVVVGLHRAVETDLLFLIFTNGCSTGRLVVKGDAFKRRFPSFDQPIHLQGDPA